MPLIRTFSKDHLQFEMLSNGGRISCEIPNALPGLSARKKGKDTGTQAVHNARLLCDALKTALKSPKR